MGTGVVVVPANGEESGLGELRRWGTNALGRGGGLSLD